MIFRAPAKLNLFLEIGPRRPPRGWPNGLARGEERSAYHEIISLIDLIDLQDSLEFLPAAETVVEFVSPWPIPEADNTVTRSISVLRASGRQTEGVRVKVVKEIPPASGLAGGSSDAACTLKALNGIWRLGLSQAELVKLALSVGSDVPLFITGTRSVVEGIGEKVTPVSVRTPFWYFLALPDFPVSTSYVYRWHDGISPAADLTQTRGKTKMLCTALQAGDVRQLEKLMGNRLQAAAEEIFPEIKEVRQYLEQASGRKFFLSGSGGTVFSIFADRGSAETVAGIFNRPGWRGLITKSIA